MITIAYCTSRRQPCLEWFLDSLELQLADAESKPELIIVDLHAQEMQRKAQVLAHPVAGYLSGVVAVPPKPTVWQGEHRLTAVDFFAQANARNTAICLALQDYIAFVDDLSVLGQRWFEAVVRGSKYGCVMCGEFQKVKSMQVRAGVLEDFAYFDAGKDPRSIGLPEQLDDIPCPPQWFFGCSCAAPLEAFLSVNGYPEVWCDGMGYEDCVTGEAIARKNYEFRYSRWMKTWESEEGHHNQMPMLRFDPGKSPDDKSHWLLEMARGIKWFPNHFSDETPTMTLLELRERTLRGHPFPIRRTPEHESFSGMLLSEFHKYTPPA